VSGPRRGPFGFLLERSLLNTRIELNCVAAPRGAGRVRAAAARRARRRERPGGGRAWPHAAAAARRGPGTTTTQLLAAPPPAAAGEVERRERREAARRSAQPSSGFDAMMLLSSARAEVTALPKVDTKCTTPSLIPTVTGNTVRSFSTHRQQSATKGSSRPLSHALTNSWFRARRSVKLD
jgi:hypothetical protein